MKSNSRSLALRIIVLVYGALYLIGFLVPLLISDPEIEEVGRLEAFTVTFAFLLFVIGAIYMFFNEKIAGIMILLWHFIVWVFSLLLWQDAGMVLVLIFPMLFPGVLLIRNWKMAQNDTLKSSERLQWKITLRVFLINYFAIYLLTVFSNVVPKLIGWELATRVDDLAVWDYSSNLGIALIISFILFLTGFIISWKNELISGILFIGWYVLILVMTRTFPGFANSGPSDLFGTTVLIQGVLYLVYHFRIKPKAADK